MGRPRLPKYVYADDPLRGNKDAIEALARAAKRDLRIYSLALLLLWLPVSAIIAAIRIAIASYTQTTTPGTMLLVQQPLTLYVLFSLLFGFAATPRIVRYFAERFGWTWHYVGTRVNSLRAGNDTARFEQRLFLIVMIFATSLLAILTSWYDRFDSDRVVRQGWLAWSTEEIKYSDIIRIIRYENTPFSGPAPRPGHLWILKNNKYVIFENYIKEIKQSDYDMVMLKISITAKVPLEYRAIRP